MSNAAIRFTSALRRILPGPDNAGVRVRLRAAFADRGVDGVESCASTIAFQRGLGEHVVAAAREAAAGKVSS